MQKFLSIFELPESMDPLKKGVIYMIISVVGFALMNLVVKFLPTIPATELVLFRSIVSLTLSLAMIRQKKLKPFGNNKKWLLIRGIFGVIALTLFFYTLQRLPIGSAITIQYLSPIFTAFFAIFLLGEKMKPIQWVYFAIAFLGIGIIKGFDSNISTMLLLAGIGSAVFSGIAYNAIRKLKDTDHPVVVVFYFPLVATPIMLVASMFIWVTPTGWEWLYLVLMGVLTQIAQINMTKAYQSAPLNKVAPLKYGGVILAISFDVFIFGIHYQWITLVGILMVIGGVILNMILKSSSKSSSSAVG